MTRRLRVVAAVLVGALMFGACTDTDEDGGSATNSASTAGTAEEAAATREGGTLRVAVPVLAPTRGNPYLGGNVAPLVYSVSPLYDGLTSINESGEPTPALALEWENTSPTTWVFRLREGVVFHNGEPFTADAVVHNVGWLRSDAGRSTVVGGDIATVTGAKAIDELTVEVTTAVPDAILPNRMAAVKIVEPGQWDRLNPEGFASAPVGTGPFQLESWDQEEVVMSAFENSWRPPILDSLVIRQIPDPAARAQALLSDQVDMAISLEPDQVAQIDQGDTSSFVVQEPSEMALAFCTLCPNGDVVADERVRLALNLAIDREAINESIFHGLSRPSSHGAGPAVDGFNPDIEPFPYDPDRARQLLEEAGHGDGFDLTFEVVGTFPGDNLMFQAVQADLQEVGVNANIVTIPQSEWLSKFFTNGWQGQAFTLQFITQSVGSVLRPYRNFSCLREPAFFCDEEQAQVLTSALGEFDDARRLELVHELGAMMHDSPPALFLLTQITVFGLRDGVEGVASVSNFVTWDEIAFAG